MGASPAFWHDEGESAEARFLAEHGAVGAFEDRYRLAEACGLAAPFMPAPPAKAGHPANS